MNKVSHLRQIHANRTKFIVLAAREFVVAPEHEQSLSKKQTYSEGCELQAVRIAALYGMFLQELEEAAGASSISGTHSLSIPQRVLFEGGRQRFESMVLPAQITCGGGEQQFRKNAAGIVPAVPA